VHVATATRVHVFFVMVLLLFSPVASAGDETVAALLNEASVLKAELRWDEAIAKLEEAVGRRAEDESSAALAQARMGQCLIGKGDLNSAEAELLQVPILFPDQPRAIHWSRLYLIEKHQHQGDFGAAEQAAQVLLAEATPTSPEFQAWAKVKLAEIPLAQGMRQEAISQLTQTVAEHKDNAPEPANWARVRLAETLMHSWALSEAEQTSDAVVADHAVGKASDEQVAWALIWKGRALTKENKFEDALVPLQMAAAVANAKHPDLVYEAEFQLGEVYRRHGDAVGRKGAWGSLHEYALAHYHAAFEQAVDANLSPDKIDQARLQTGSEMRHLGMRDRGIAGLRMGIEEPTNLTDMDRLLAERLVSFMSHEEAEAWQNYMLSPTHNTDPLASVVLEEFGQPAPQPSSSAVNRLCLRHYWLGRLYEKQGRLTEALDAFQQALFSSTSALPEGRARAGIARASHALVRQMSEQGAYEEARTLHASAIEEALATADMLLQYAVDAEPGDAHEATELAVVLCEEIKRPADALMVADDFVAILATSPIPSKRAFAELMQARALSWNKRFVEAVDAAEQLGDFITGEESLPPDMETIHALSLIDLAGYRTLVGEPHAGIDILDAIGDQYGTKYDHWVAPQREAIRAFLRVR